MWRSGFLAAVCLLLVGCDDKPATTPLNLSGGGPAVASAGSKSRAEIQQLFELGVRAELANQGHLQTLARYLPTISDDQLANLNSILAKCPNQSQQVLILKTLIAGEPWEYVTRYADEIRGKPEEEVIAKSLMRQPENLSQQWEDACGPAIVEVAVAEQDPRFAWELNKGFPVHTIDPLGANKSLADQQKQWIEQYGGVAVPRGAGGGKGVGILELLNGTLGPIVRATYTCYPVKTVEDGLDKIVATLRRGYTVPIRVEWIPGNNGHFMLALAMRGDGESILIYDPWHGKTSWLLRSDIISGGISPERSLTAKLTHYYEPTSTAPDAIPAKGDPNLAAATNQLDDQSDE